MCVCSVWCVVCVMCVWEKERKENPGNLPPGSSLPEVYGWCSFSPPFRVSLSLLYIECPEFLAVLSRRNKVTVCLLRFSESRSLLDFYFYFVFIYLWLRWVFIEDLRLLIGELLLLQSMGSKAHWFEQLQAMAPYSSTLAWKIPWTEEPGRLQSMGSLRVGHNWATWLSLFTFMHWRRKWQPTPVFLPENPRDGGAWWLPSMGSHRVRHAWSDLA